MVISKVKNSKTLYKQTAEAPHQQLNIKGSQFARAEEKSLFGSIELVDGAEDGVFRDVDRDEFI